MVFQIKSQKLTSTVCPECSKLVLLRVKVTFGLIFCTDG